MSLEAEIKTYEEHKERLLGEHRGEFVLIKGTEVADVFSSYDDALAAGYKRFGDTEFLVKEIVEFEQVNFFSRPLPLS